MPTPQYSKRMQGRAKAIIATVGPDGEIDLPADVLRHVGLLAGGFVIARKYPGKSIIIRRSKQKP
jgi:hypothetical protein